MRAERAYCECAEAFVGDKKVVPPRWHNCEYIALRNRGLNNACRMADAQVSDMPDTTDDERVAKLAKRAQLISKQMDNFGAKVLAGMASRNNDVGEARNNNNNNASEASAMRALASVEE